jgi:hypothetical protein
MLVFLAGPTKASKAVATSNWTQVQTQAAKRTQVHAPGGSWMQGRTQAAKGTQGSQTDASADASSKPDARLTDACADARQTDASADARQPNGRKCRRNRTQVQTQMEASVRKRMQMYATGCTSGKTDTNIHKRTQVDVNEINGLKWTQRNARSKTDARKTNASGCTNARRDAPHRSQRQKASKTNA